MRAGEFAEGERVLRAKIDMAHPNMNMRDPILYRIRHAAHHQTGDAWCIYPTYDFAHGQEDAIEGVTHSICTLEFEDHRPLYDWFIENLPVRAAAAVRVRAPEHQLHGHQQAQAQAAGGRGHRSGWDDPRMPTIAGMRRRGFTPAAIRQFCEMVGTSRSDGVADVAMLEHAIRDDLNQNAPRAMCVLRPLRPDAAQPAADHAPLTGARAPEPRGPRQRELPILRRAVHRPRGFSRGGEQEVQAPGAGQARAPAQRLRDRGVDVEKDADGRDHGGDRRRDRGHPRRRPGGRRQAQGRDSLGGGGQCRARDGAPLRPPVHRPGAGPRRRRLHAVSQPRTRCR
jgi:glutaminyl-tRNA synthetase